MTARIIFALVAVPAAAVILVARVMEASVPAGTLLACVLFIAAGWYVTWLMIGGKGTHKAPLRRYDEASERIALPCERVIPRAQTEHAPPWEGEAAIEPAAITSGPPEPEPQAIIIAAGNSRDGLTSVHVAVLEPLPPPLPAGELPDWVVVALNGHASAEDALDSIVNRAMLTDGAS